MILMRSWALFAACQKKLTKSASKLPVSPGFNVRPETDDIVVI